MSSAQPAAYAIGIDVGGTKVVAALIECQRGVVRQRHAFATRAERPGAAVLADVVALAQQLVAESPDGGRTPIGIGVAELVGPDGTITSGHTIAWNGLRLAQAFGHSAPVVVESDVRAHARAEAALGAGHGYKSFVFVTIGTGISNCLVQDGEPWRGAQGNALVLATGVQTFYHAEMSAPTRFDLEGFASGAGLAARYALASGQPVARAEVVLAAAEAGDKQATQIVASAATALGSALGWLVNVLDPHAIVVGGGLGSAPGRYWEVLLAATRAHIWATGSRDLPIVQAALGADAGVIGAALSAF